ncbi:uncharacterized protein LOC142337760 [Convolutriloba macropyga]|uniref:uncharacterized protein LOC142337760 n=1 Tax=Convolutriloba macropyga TaxID=536237 RepID=UPI003F523689
MRRILFSAVFAAALFVLTTNGDYVDMSKEYLDKLSEFIKKEMYDKVKEAHKNILEHQISWQIEEENAQVWRKDIDELSDKVMQHVTALEKAKNDILSHSKHQCINLLQVQKLKCLDCVSTQCNAYAKDTCNFETNENSILEKIIKYLMDLFHIKTQMSQEELSQQAVEESAKNLRETTEKLIYQLDLAKKTLEEAGSKVDLSVLKSNMEEVTATGKEYVQDISTKIENSEIVLEQLLNKDKQIQETLDKEIAEAKAVIQTSSKIVKQNKSIFGKVWDETKEIFGETMCLITFGYWCPNKKSTSTQQSTAVEVEEPPKFDPAVLGSLPTCDKLQANISLCLNFVKSCDSECFNMDINDICPRWYEEWKGYKRAWKSTKASLQHVYSELQAAEEQMMTAIEKHNTAVAKVLTQFGWLSVYANSSKPLELIKVLNLQFDPASFDEQIVNKFTNSSIQVKLADGKELTISMTDLVDPYDAKTVAETAMKHIEEIEKKKHFEDNDIAKLIAKFMKQK